MDSKSDRRPDDLIQAYLDGSMTPGEADELLGILRTDPAVTERLFEALRTDAMIRRAVKAIEEEAAASDSGPAGLQVDLSAVDSRQASSPAHQAASLDEDEVRRIKEYAEYQLESFLAEQQRQRSRAYRVTRRGGGSLDVMTVASRVDRLMAVASKVAVGAALCAVMGMAILVTVQYALSHRVVAVLADCPNARWSTAVQAKELRPGRMSLEQGFAHLIFKSGAEVLVQAPAAFRLQSAKGLFLESGRVTAKVPKQAIGFTVKTSEADVVDFGTEFGVMVGGQSLSEVHVFDGRISLAAAGRAASASPQSLVQGDTATIDGYGRIARSHLADRPPLFVREIPAGPSLAIPGKRLNLADIAGGGNGLDTGTPGQGINPLTGQTGLTRWVVEAPGEGFVRTPSLAFVDGVFVPGSSTGPMVVSSTGIVAQDCTDGSGFCYQGIANGAVFQHRLFNPHPARLAGLAFNTLEHPSLGMHANAGITFDLDQIRLAMPEVAISRFKALAGLSETVADYSADGTWDSRRITVRFWVLVDGRVRFSGELAAVPSEPRRIEVPLSDTDRFLSLMTTTADRRCILCWSMFADPALELRPATLAQSMIRNP
jgi:hypothetical protein